MYGRRCGTQAGGETMGGGLCVGQAASLLAPGQRSLEAQSQVGCGLGITEERHAGIALCELGGHKLFVWQSPPPALQARDTGTWGCQELHKVALGLRTRGRAAEQRGQCPLVPYSLS